MDAFVVYKNFPAEVLEMGEAEYWLRQILMYWGVPNDLVTQDAKERPALDEDRPKKILHPAAPEAITEIFRSMVSSSARWTPEQQEDVLHLALEHPQLQREVKLSDVPFKENMVELGVFLSDLGIDVHVENATDTLRLAAAMSHQDISFAQPPKFRRFARRERRALLRMLEASKNLEEDVARRPEMFKRLMRELHPGDYALRYPRVVEIYDKLYKGASLETFNSRLERLLEADDPLAIEMLSSRPGEFVRRLHACMLKFGLPAAEAFAGVVGRLTTVQLVKIQRYLETTNGRRWRMFAPRGNWTRVQILENARERTLSKDLLGVVLSAIGRELERRVGEVAPKVNLDERTAWVKLQTNDSELSPYGRGTSFPIPKSVKFVRTACYWATGPTAYHVWFDNGWNFFGPKWEPVGACCWNVPGFGSKAAIFSGDPTNAKDLEGRACQLIDLYLDKLEKAGVRYAVWNVLCYSRIPFSSANDVFAALQWGLDPKKGKLFEPSRAQLAFPITGDNYTKYVAYLDLQERRMVYMDANLKASVASAAQNTALLSEVMPAFEEYLDALPSVHDVFKHQPADEHGLQVRYTDADHVLRGEQAYVFRPQNEASEYEPFDLNALLARKAE